MRPERGGTGRHRRPEKVGKMLYLLYIFPTDLKRQKEVILLACFHPKLARMIWDNYAKKYIVSFTASSGGEQIYIPCGKCLGCKADHGEDWAVRCQLEAMQYPAKNWFITLTYDDEFLPLVECVVCDPDTGELIDSGYVPTLCKRDWQLFEKQVRNTYGAGMRFLACGEYGETTGRPHFHAVLMNVDVKDAKQFKTVNGVMYYTSQALDHCWANKGHVLIAPYAYQTGAYVAKYMTKSEYKLSDGYIDEREKPKLFMSRRPGLARQFYDDNKEHLLEFDKVTLPGEDGQGARTVKPPAYFDYLHRKDETSLERYIEMKEMRRAKARYNEERQNDATDKDVFARKRDQEQIWFKRKRVRK